MSFHRNAKLGLAGRYALMCAVASDGAPLVAPLAGGERGDAGDAVVSVRSLEPATSSAAAARTRARRGDLRLPDKDRLGATVGPRRDRLLPLDGLEVLKRAGISRPPRPLREQANRYEWPCPGDLLHMDVSRYARFLRPGHRVTGDRSRIAAEVERRVGYDYVHALVDDHSRLA